MKSDLIDIVCQIRRDAPTQQAIAVADGTTQKDAQGNEREKWFWLPRSQIEINQGDNGLAIVTMPEWLATEKGLI